MQSTQDKLTVELYEKIKKAAAQLGEDNGYAIIVEGKSVLWTAAKVFPTEVTDQLIKVMNEKTTR
jgi:Skp family chaperone for outer membrane proteins